MPSIITTKPITLDDVIEREAHEEVAREIVNGEWAEETEMASFEHGQIGARLIAKLVTFLDEHPLGVICQDGTTYVLEGTPQNIILQRVPDVSFITAQRAKDLPRKSILFTAPDLAVEIISTSERRKTITAKIRDYLTHGTQEVWVIYPDEKQITIHFPDHTTTVYSSQDTLTSENLLPNFSLNVAKLFDF